MKLLVNAPSGKQEVIEVGEGGGYFDPSRVLWDEREDGPLPEITLGGMVRNGGALEFSQDRMDEHTEASGPTRAQRKQARAEAVAAIKVTTTSGKTFDGDEDSQARMARAVLIAQATGLTETSWTLADNTIATVTLPELTEALALAGQQQAALWPIPPEIT